MTTNLRLVYDNHRIAKLVAAEFGDAPRLAHFLAQCLTAFDEKSVAEEIGRDVYQAVLRHFRQELALRFGLLAGGKMLLRDISEERSRRVLAQFGPHIAQARECFDAKVTERGIDKIYVFEAMAKRLLVSSLVATSHDVEYPRDRDRLARIAFLAWMASSPRRPAVLGNTATALGVLVDNLLAGDGELTGVTLPAPALKIVQPVPRLRLVENND